MIQVSDDMRTEIAQANAAVESAHAHLSHASGEYVDVAIYELTAAEKRRDALLREARLEAM